MSIELVCNQAIDVIGYSRHIGNIYDGTKAATILLNCYVETRDTLLAAMRPDWALGFASLTLLKSAPNIVNGIANYPTATWGDVYPALPWLYEYQYPVDCIDPLQIIPSVYFLPVWRPRSIPFRLNSTVAKRTILTNEPNARLKYIKVVADPDDWHEDFREALIMALAKRLEAGLTPERTVRHQQQQGQSNANNPS